MSDPGLGPAAGAPPGLPMPAMGPRPAPQGSPNPLLGPRPTPPGVPGSPPMPMPPGAISAALAAAGPPAAGPPPGLPPGMIINPAFLQWRQLAEARMEAVVRREEQFLDACKLLAQDAGLNLQIDIEADSTIAADEQAEKQARTEFLQSVLPMLQLLLPQVQQNPAIAPLIKALVMFGIHAFPTARDLEEDFENAFKLLANSPPPPPPPPKGNVKPPEEIASEAAIARGEQQVDAAKVQVEQQQNAVEMFKAYSQSQLDQQKAQMEARFRAIELALKGQETQTRAQLAQARTERLAASEIAGGGGLP